MKTVIIHVDKDSSLEKLVQLAKELKLRATVLQHDHANAYDDPDTEPRALKEPDPKYDEVPAAKLASIRRGLEQIERGELTPHEEARKIYEKWL